MNSALAVEGNLAISHGGDSCPQLTVIDGGLALRTPAFDRVSSSAPRLARSGAHRKALACLAVVGLICLALGSSFAFARSSHRASLLAELDRTAVVVTEGDTLWGIVHELDLDGVPAQEAIRLIRDWNDLDSGLITPGMRLVVPVSPR